MDGTEKQCSHDTVAGLRSALNQRAYRFAKLLHLHPRQINADFNRAMGVGRRTQAGEAQLRRGLAYADEQLKALAAVAKQHPGAGGDPPG